MKESRDSVVVPVLYTVDEAAQALRLSRSALYELILSGRPPRYVVNPAVLPAWMKKWGSGN